MAEASGEVVSVTSFYNCKEAYQYFNDSRMRTEQPGNKNWYKTDPQLNVGLWPV